MGRLTVVVLLIAGSCALVLGRSPALRPHYRLVQPWSKMKTLSDDQREQIYYIHRKSLDKMKEIKAQEQRDILELLSDDQKLELVEIDEASTVARKLRAAAAREYASPTTAPSSSADDSKSHDKEAD